MQYSHQVPQRTPHLPGLQFLSSWGRTTAGDREGFVIADLKGALLVRQSDEFPDELGVPDFVGEVRGRLLAVSSHMRAGAVMDRCLAECCALLGELAPGALAGAELLAGLREAHERAAALAAREVSAVVPSPADPAMTTAFVGGNMLYVAGVGDSGCYLLREGLLYHVCGAAGGDPEVRALPLRVGDRVLVTTHGLPGIIDGSDIARQLHLSEDARAACDALIDNARLVDGVSDVTVIAAHAG
jgi:hypothetical protein